MMPCGISKKIVLQRSPKDGVVGERHDGLHHPDVAPVVAVEKVLCGDDLGPRGIGKLTNLFKYLLNINNCLLTCSACLKNHGLCHSPTLLRVVFPISEASMNVPLITTPLFLSYQIPSMESTAGSDTAVLSNSLNCV